MGYIIIIHGLVFIITLVGIPTLLLALRKAPRNDLIVNMIIWSLLLLINASLFSFVYLLDSMSGYIFNPNIYNWWGAFIRIQNVTTVTWVGLLVLKRYYKLEVLTFIKDSFTIVKEGAIALYERAKKIINQWRR